MLATAKTPVHIYLAPVHIGLVFHTITTTMDRLGSQQEHFQLTFTQVKGKQRSFATQAFVAYATAPNSLRSKGARAGEFRTIPLVLNSLKRPAFNCS
ncbi:MAG: hypothetical protein IIA73_01585 [Proteobacteria bacterium]|nr:hypothetical protein [Pseudomonadota bacterium]